MQRDDADRRADDLDRFYGHLASFTVVALTALLLSIAASVPPSWVIAAFAAWGALLACHGMSVFMSRAQPRQPA